MLEVTVDDTLMHVSFADHFNDETLSDVGTFFVGTRKKNFQRDDVQEYFNLIAQDDESCKNAVVLAKAIRDPAMVTISQLQAGLQSLFTDKLLVLMDEYVQRRCAENNIDLSPSSEVKNPNVELQFTNEHGWMILKWSVCCNMVIPYIMTYCFMRKMNKREIDRCMLEALTNIVLVLPESKHINILQKMSKFIDNRIEQTEYSDRIMWKFLKTVGIDRYIVRYDILNNVVLEIIPKLEQGRNIVSFLHTVIKLKLQYVFQTNFLLAYRPIAISSPNSDEKSPLEGIEQQLSRRNEGLAILTRVNVEEFIAELKAKFKPSSIEIQKLVQEIQQYNGLTKIQLSLAFMFLMKEIRSVKTLKTLNLVNIATVLCCLQNWFKQHEGFSELPMYISAYAEESAQAKGVFRKRARSEFMASTAYIELVETHFKSAAELFATSNVIPELVSSLITSEYFDYTTKKELDITCETVSQELLLFVNHVMVSNSL